MALIQSATAIARDSTNDCFDAVVQATVVRQTPTIIPECADCIVMRWPWVIELDVERIIKGKVYGSSLTALSVQHTWFIPRSRRWWLRHNTLGVFNVVTGDEAASLQQCAKGSPPDRPYIQPAKGRTLADLVREGERLYGEMPDAARPN